MRTVISIFLFATVVTTMAAARHQQFHPIVYYKTPATGSLNPGTVSADFNGDTWPDLAVAQGISNRLDIYLNQGDGTLTLASTIRVLAPGAVAVGDLNEDGHPDLVILTALNRPSGKVSVFLGNGDGSFSSGNEYGAGKDPLQVVLADFNGDGHLDAAEVNFHKGGVSVFFGDGHGALGTPGAYNRDQVPVSIAAADVNGDGHPDLLVGESPEALGVWLNRGDGTFSRGRGTDNVLAISIEVADLNRDGNPDAILSGAGVLNILVGKGNGAFNDVLQYQFSADSLGMVIEDFNLDGNLDVAVVTLSNGVSLFYGNGDGTMQEVRAVNFRALGGTALAAADFDKDGAPDIAVNTVSHRIAVLMNAQ